MGPCAESVCTNVEGLRIYMEYCAILANGKGWRQLSPLPCIDELTTPIKLVCCDQMKTLTSLPWAAEHIYQPAPILLYMGMSSATC